MKFGKPIMLALGSLLIPVLAGPLMGQAAPKQWRGPEHIYQSTCAYCHDKGIAPVLKGRKLSPDAIAAIARNGVPGMPSFHPSEISDEDLKILGKWIEQSEAGKK